MDAGIGTRLKSENIKSPKHGCAYNMRLAGRGWQTEPHLWETIAPLQDPVRLRFMEIPLGESKWASALLALSWHTLARRAFSLAKHSAPPESLVGVLALSMEAKTRALQELEAGHRNFLLLERRALDSEDAARLRKDMIFLDSLQMEFCRCSGGQLTSKGDLIFLSAVLIGDRRNSVYA